MEEVGRVVGVRGNLASVEVTDSAISCSSCSSCLSTLSLGASSSEAVRVLELVNSIGADVGDFVVFELKESVSIFISIVIYVFPVLMMLCGYFLGDYSGYVLEAGALKDNVFAIIVSFIFLFFGLVIVYFLDRFFSRRKSFSPQLRSFYKNASE